MALALAARLRCGGWYALFAVIFSLVTLGSLPVFAFGPIIYFGFVAPMTAWPLLVLADVLLLTSAVAMGDSVDGTIEIPILPRNAPMRSRMIVHRIGIACGVGYLASLAPLFIAVGAPRGLVGWLLLLWGLVGFLALIACSIAMDRKVPKSSGTSAPKQYRRKKDPKLTDELARQRTIEHVVHTLQQLPDGWIVGFQRPGWKPLGAWSGVASEGEWEFSVDYWVWGYGDLTGDEVFEAFVKLWESWGWIDSAGSDIPQKKSARGHTPDGYHVGIRRGVHGGVSMQWTSPYFPASGSAYGGVMPSIITKDGPQSYEQPQRD
ncbi:hypothetical protein [Mycobacteroides abscessus]|uniref:hypothetical protein n=1 Tax=Mycobacteroides abscessus TaxID=36809 RepID=UPI001F49095A|nr:hypothetical protein [Mycobacteroides abscessus]